MFSVSSELPVHLKGNCSQTLRFCKRYFNLKQEFDNALHKKRADEAKKVYENEEKNTSDEGDHPDPLEFRNVGPYKPKIHFPYFQPNLISKNSVLRDSRTGHLIDSIEMLLQNSSRKDQNFNAERFELLGPDLAAAHFITCRGGGVKFVGESKFIRCKVNKSYLVLPNEKDLNYKLEAIDVSGMDLVYEGISNLIGLKYLSWISFKNCSNFNNWFLDRLSCVTPTIEYLDISGCKKIDHLAISCLYRFRNLKCVNVQNTNDSNEFKLSCLTYESEYPNITFIGIDLKPKPKSVFD